MNDIIGPNIFLPRLLTFMLTMQPERVIYISVLDSYLIHSYIIIKVEVVRFKVQSANFYMPF